MPNDPEYILLDVSEAKAYAEAIATQRMIIQSLDAAMKGGFPDEPWYQEAKNLRSLIAGEMVRFVRKVWDLSESLKGEW
jgi:hypothetical protein